MDGVRYRRELTWLNPDDRLVFCTDGVTETDSDYNGSAARGREGGRRYRHRCAEEVSAIDGDVIAFTGDVEQFNDITSFITEYVGLGSFRLGARCTPSRRL